MNATQILLLPGWQNSTEGHWQTEWEQAYGYQRVEQHDWLTPKRGDWCARLEEVVADAQGPVVLAAHSLGCILVAWWAAHSRHTHRVRGALLVAPGDVERPEVAEQIRGWAPIARQTLPFATILAASSDDPYCTLPRARELAGLWGARLVEIGACGHVNAASGLGLWPQGHGLLQRLVREEEQGAGAGAQHNAAGDERSGPPSAARAGAPDDTRGSSSAADSDNKGAGMGTGVDAAPAAPKQ